LRSTTRKSQCFGSYVIPVTIVGNHQLTEELRAEHERQCHRSLGCPIYDCRCRFSDTDNERKIDKHRAIHILTREFGLAEPNRWTGSPQKEVPHGRKDDQAIISPLQYGTVPEFAFVTDSSQSAENVVNVTEPLLEHPSDE